MLNVLRPVLARVAAALIGAAAAWLAAKGVELDAETQAQLIEGIVGLMLAVFGVVYAVAHKMINARLNPADTATPALANKVLVTAGERGVGDTRPTSVRGVI